MKKSSDYVGVDEKFIPEEEKYVEETINYDKDKVKKYVKGGIAIYLVIVGIIFIIVISFIVVFFIKFHKVSKTVDKRIDRANQAIQSQIDDMNNSDSSDSEIKQQYDQAKENNNTLEKESFNTLLSMFEGKQRGSNVNVLLNKIISSNGQNSNHLITVVYGDISTTDSTSIISIESNIESLKDYSVVYGYDSNGYINNVTISELQ